MITSSSHQIGYKTSFVHFGKLSLAFAQDNKTKLNCIVFYDPTDQQEFGRILSRAILSGFTCEFHSQVARGGPWMEEQFQSFQRVLPEIIKGSIQTIIQNLVAEKGVDRVTVSSGTSFYSTDEIDQVSFLPNLDELLENASDLMSFHDDFPFIVSLDNLSKRVLIQKIEKATVVLMCSAKLDLVKCKSLLSSTCIMVERVLMIQPDQEIVF